jgi:DNA polymerase/3'-5' exonuclease PolX
MLYEKAKQIAISAGTSLKQYCEIIHIAGSIRRRKWEIKDVELICIPRYTEQSFFDLFGAPIKTKIISTNFIAAVKSLGKIVKGGFDGRYMQVNHRGTMIDIFIPETHDFFRQYVIRTGSTDYIKNTIGKRWVEMGWCGTDQGLRRQSDCKLIIGAGGKKTWEIDKHNGDRPPAWESEKAFYEWLNLKYLHPRFRTI